MKVNSDNKKEREREKKINRTVLYYKSSQNSCTFSGVQTTPRLLQSVLIVFRKHSEIILVVSYNLFFF